MTVWIIVGMLAVFDNFYFGLGAYCTNPSSQMISSGKIEASGEGGRDGVQLD